MVVSGAEASVLDRKNPAVAISSRVVMYCNLIMYDIVTCASNHHIIIDRKSVV